MDAEFMAILESCGFNDWLGIEFLTNDASTDARSGVGYPRRVDIRFRRNCPSNLASSQRLAYPRLMSHLTEILSKIEAGDPQASSELLPLVYEELRKLAAQRMAAERPDHTLQATALVHEAYVRLVDTDQAVNWDSRGHFFAAAAEAMRRILVEHARSKARQRRGGDVKRLDMTEFPESAGSLAPEQILELDDALEKLKGEDPAVAELVRLRVYAGLSAAEAASVMRISRSKAFEDWDYALSWFAVELDS